MLVTSEHALFLREVREEREALRAIGDEAVAVDRHRPTHELTEVVPIEVVAVFELPHQAFGIEAVTRLPQLQHDEPADDERLVEGPVREYAKIVDVARLVSLIARANLLGNDFGQGETVDGGGCEWQLLKVALLGVWTALGGKRRGLAAADLEPDLAAARIPFMNIGWINAPREAELMSRQESLRAAIGASPNV